LVVFLAAAFFFAAINETTIH